MTVPGAVDGWVQMHQRFGKLPWEDLFQAAIAYAEVVVDLPQLGNIDEQAFRPYDLERLVGVGKRLHSRLLESDVDPGRVGPVPSLRQEIGAKVASGNETTGECQVSESQCF